MILRNNIGNHQWISDYVLGFFITSFVLFEEHRLENCKIELIEEFCCDTKEQLLQREGCYIRQTQCVNKVVPDRTKKEHTKEYYLKNSDKIAEHRKQYYDTSPEKREDVNRKFYEKTRQTQLEKQKEQITCLLCGCIARRGDIARHRRTAKCQRLSEGQV